MTPERWQLIKGILGEALEQSGDQRDAYIVNACGKDEQLRAQIESLLHHDGEAESEYFLKQRTLLYESSQSGPVKVCETQVPDEIGGHQLLEEIGRGGMGVVYKAKNIKLNRTVALKMILTGQLATTEAIDRFRTEAQAAAKLDHPNIVPVYEVGEESGHHFFSMGLVEGESLADRLDQGPMPEREAAELIKVIAKAVDYAHHQGILHRDLKPSNILLSHDDTPKVTDFGLAKLLDDESTKTHTGVAGTPSYMSPEQVSGKTKSLGPATDVYALGAILYEAVTGRRPFQAATALETLAQVCSREPVSPRKLQPRLSRDVDTICLKCLQKEPISRYESADALSDDLQRFLDSEPIRARRAGYITRARRWCRRHPVSIAVAVTLLVAVTGVLGILVHNETRRRERETERQGERQAELRAGRRADYLSDMQLAEREWEAGRFGEVLACLNRYDAPESGEEDLRGWEWYYQQRLCQQEIDRFDAKVGAVFDIAMHPDRKRLAGAYRDGKVRIWEIASGKLNETILFEASPEESAGDSTQIYPTTVAFSPDGRWIAAGAIAGRVKLFSVEKASERRILASPAQEQGLLTDTVWEVAFSRDGSWLAACDNAGTIAIWDARNWNLVSQIALPFDNEASRPISDIEFSADGRYLAAGCADGRLPVWELTESEVKVELAREFSGEKGRRLYCLAFHPDGDKVAFAGQGSFVRIVNLRTGKVVSAFAHDQDRVRSVAFSHDGNQLAVAAEDSTLKVWECSNLTLPKLKRNIRGHSGPIYSTTFSPDDHFLASASADGMIKLWDQRSGVDSLQIVGGHHFKPVGCVLFTQDGQRMVSADQDGRVCVWDLKSLQLLRKWLAHEAEVNFATVNSDGLVATASADNEIRLWQIATGSHEGTLIGHEKGVTHVTFSHDGRTIVSASGDKTVILWDARSLQKKRVLSGHTATVYAVVFSPDDARLASVDDSGTMRIWDAGNGQLVKTVTGSEAGLRDVKFSRDGTKIATCDKAGEITLRDAGTFELIHRLSHEASVNSPAAFSLAFLPDGRRLVATGGDSALRIWDTIDGKLVRTLLGHQNQVQCVAVSPDGELLASSSYDNNVRVWDARPFTARVRIDHEAVGLVSHLSEQPLVRSDVVDLIADWPTASKAVKSAATEIAAYFPSETKHPAQWFNDRGRAIVKRTHQPAIQYEIARRQAQTACRLEPQKDSYRQTLGWAYFRTGLWAKAADELYWPERAVKDNPKSTEDAQKLVERRLPRFVLDVTRLPRYLVNAIEIPLNAHNGGAVSGELVPTENNDVYFFVAANSGPIVVEIESVPPLVTMAKLFRESEGFLDGFDAAVSDVREGGQVNCPRAQPGQIYYVQVSRRSKTISGKYSVSVRGL